MFVLNIDEIMFEACCPTSVKEDVEETEYRVPNIYRWMTPKVRVCLCLCLPVLSVCLCLCVCVRARVRVCACMSIICMYI